VSERSLTEELDFAETDELMWALVVVHANGKREIQGWDGTAAVVLADAAVDVMREWLLRDEPVTCVEAAGAGLDLLADCELCVPAGSS
jgi:hypothetical protein